MSDRGISLQTVLGWLALATLALAASAQADANPDPHRQRPMVTPAPPSPARDGISGSSMGRATAHAGLGGPATTKAATMGSINLKQHH
jgi:hypothetical protein